ncbi:unnamed protein product [Closterium sp. Naga37s-1]|nr:unnamed protein product [Closterium sp. Naga37s-1]
MGSAKTAHSRSRVFASVLPCFAAVVVALLPRVVQAVTVPLADSQAAALKECATEWGMSAAGWAQGAACAAETITCDGDGMVKSLTLFFKNLTGSIPLALTALSRLESLRLADNHLTGPVFTVLAQMPSLLELELYSNNFTGPVPLTVSRLQKLSHLDLKSNNFHGPLPQAFTRLTALTHLRIAEMGLSGPLLHAITALSSLNLLDASGNNISGSIPATISALSSLEYLMLGQNSHLSGSLPSTLSRLTTLKELSAQPPPLAPPYHPHLSAPPPTHLSSPLPRSSPLPPCFDSTLHFAPLHHLSPLCLPCTASCSTCCLPSHAPHHLPPHPRLPLSRPSLLLPCPPVLLFSSPLLLLLFLPPLLLLSLPPLFLLLFLPPLLFLLFLSLLFHDQHSLPLPLSPLSLRSLAHVPTHATAYAATMPSDSLLCLPSLISLLSSYLISLPRSSFHLLPSSTHRLPSLILLPLPTPPCSTLGDTAISGELPRFLTALTRLVSLCAPPHLLRSSPPSAPLPTCCAPPHPLRSSPPSASLPTLCAPPHPPRSSLCPSLHRSPPLCNRCISSRCHLNRIPSLPTHSPLNSHLASYVSIVPPPFPPSLSPFPNPHPFHGCSGGGAAAAAGGGVGGVEVEEGEGADGGGFDTPLSTTTPLLKRTPACPHIPLADILRATDGWAEERRVGGGRWGDVYRGVWVEEEEAGDEEKHGGKDGGKDGKQQGGEVQGGSQVKREGSSKGGGSQGKRDGSSRGEVAQGKQVSGSGTKKLSWRRGEKWAVKRMRGGMHGAESAELEAHVAGLASLVHPNVLGLVAWCCFPVAGEGAGEGEREGEEEEAVGGEGGNQLVLVYKWMERGSLQAALQPGGTPLSLQQRVDVAVGVLLALKAVQSHGQVHGDLKPSNVLLSPAFEARVVDWSVVCMGQRVHVDMGNSGSEGQRKGVGKKGLARIVSLPSGDRGTSSSNGKDGGNSGYSWGAGRSGSSISSSSRDEQKVYLLRCTEGHVDPAVVHTGIATPTSDMYSMLPSLHISMLPSLHISMLPSFILVCWLPGSPAQTTTFPLPLFHPVSSTSPPAVSPPSPHLRPF